jgi:energy-coupling factor transporter ATP-binding protein EcfA2
MNSPGSARRGNEVTAESQPTIALATISPAVTCDADDIAKGGVTERCHISNPDKTRASLGRNDTMTPMTPLAGPPPASGAASPPIVRANAFNSKGEPNTTDIPWRRERVAFKENEAFVDCGADDMVLRITPSGCSRDSGAQAIFLLDDRRLPIAAPTKGGELQPLIREHFPNVSETDALLLMAFSVAAWTEPSLRMPIRLLGPEGSGKTSLAESLKALLDPSTNVLYDGGTEVAAGTSRVVVVPERVPNKALIHIPEGAPPMLCHRRPDGFCVAPAFPLLIYDGLGDARRQAVPRDTIDIVLSPLERRVPRPALDQRLLEAAPRIVSAILELCVESLRFRVSADITDRSVSPDLHHLLSSVLGALGNLDRVPSLVGEVRSRQLSTRSESDVEVLAIVDAAYVITKVHGNPWTGTISDFLSKVNLALTEHGHRSAMTVPRLNDAVERKCFELSASGVKIEREQRKAHMRPITVTVDHTASRREKAASPVLPATTPQQPPTSFR